MTVAPDTADPTDLVALQMGRPPRTPWRVAAQCGFGYPTVIASPSTLADGTPFPTLYWLTCPYLMEAASAAESSGWLAEWDARAAENPATAQALAAADAALRDRRAAESGGVDACSAVGVAGQASPTAAKCVHARVALALVGVEDPIGAALLERSGASCPDRRCATLTAR